MTLFIIIRFIILIHAIFGGLSLISGTIAFLSNKGKKIHTLSGKIFYYSLGISILISLMVAIMPGHYNPFLFSIGVFSLYFILIGRRAINYKNPNHNFLIDRLIHCILILTGSSMIIMPYILNSSFNLVSGIFGIIGISFGIKNLLILRQPSTLKSQWLRVHIIHISGGYIAAISAFLVVNQVFMPLLNWFLPSITGTAAIIYFLRKIQIKKYQVFSMSIPLIILTFIFTHQIKAQNEILYEPLGKEIGIRVGISKTRLQDRRLSAKTFYNWSPKYGIQIGNRKTNNQSRTRIDFTYIKGHKKDKSFTINSILSQVNYSFQYQAADGLWIGGFFNNFTLINFPKSFAMAMFTNNIISYTMIQSIGPGLGFYPSKKNNSAFVGNIEIPLLGYVVQPIYGHPYPENFLKEGTFNPTREGMTIPMLKSGKFLSLPKFSSIKLEVGLFYYPNPDYKLGIEIQGEMVNANANGKSVRILSNDVILSAGYIY
ncbi:MAG: hypothetical protein IPG18_06400 [Saprospiraceae bacterium]|nr:hypothetical protein [Saprospiraceae bacterium]MBK8853603.1 hypothetical protein [Saprospiraceae bacterium]MBK9041819.1 hypothetical protein [Saprospiraceae bacterium]